MIDLTPAPVEVFSVGHLAFLAASAMFCTFAVSMGRKLEEKSKRRLLIALWLTFTAVEAIRYIRFAVFPETFDVKTCLPFHLCSISIFTYPLAIFIDNQTFKNFVYAVNMPGAVFALITPDIGDAALFSFYFVHTMISHTFIVLIPLYMVCCGFFRPDIRKLPSVALMLLISMIPALLLNHFLGSNYYFINGPVKGTFTETLADIVSDEFYLIPMLITLIIVWLIMYLPFIIQDIYKKHKEVADKN